MFREEKRRAIHLPPKEEGVSSPDMMKSGKWQLNGEAVKFAQDGTLLDGQHRLFACVRANVPFTTIVIRGLENEAQDTMDTGRKRSMSDILLQILCS